MSRLVLLSLVLAVGWGVAPQAPPPTLIVIMTDDQRFDTMAAMPLTRAWLGDGGTTFSNAYIVSPLCCPARASFFTGQYPSQHGVVDNTWPEGGAAKMDDSATLPVVLKAAGWRTAYAGKYLNEFAPWNTHLPSWPYTPPGWTDFRALVDPDYQNYSMLVHGATVTYGTGPANYSTTVITNHALEQLSQTPPEQSLFLFVGYNAPHLPSKAANQADTDAVATMVVPQSDALNEADVSDKPAWVRALPLLTTAAVTKTTTDRRKAVATLLAVDRGVDALMRSLQTSGRLSNAVVMFTSDHGLMAGEHRIRDGKRCGYEECVKVPLLIRTATTGGAVDARLVSSLDLTATLADYAGVVMPQAGRSLKAVLEGGAPAWRDALFVEWSGLQRPKFLSVRDDQGWVLIDYLQASQGAELYHLGSDPFQLVNRYTDPAAALDRARLEQRLATRTP